jgi:hypothetical protein
MGRVCCGILWFCLRQGGGKPKIAPGGDLFHMLMLCLTKPTPSCSDRRVDPAEDGTHGQSQTGNTQLLHGFI